MMSKDSAKASGECTVGMVPSMEAGPELDRLVAERVMGWWIGDCEAHFLVESVESFPAYLRGSKKWDARDRVYRSPAHNSEFWSPSTSIADAWEVVEKMDTGNSFQLSTRFTDWWASFTISTNVSASTAPLAICRAALLAVLSQEDQSQTVNGEAVAPFSGTQTTAEQDKEK